VLSGYHILGKLATFSLTRYAEINVTQGLGALIQHMPGLEDIAQKANLEGVSFRDAVGNYHGDAYQGLARFYTESALKGFDDAMETLKTGKSTLKAELGEKRQNVEPIHWYDYPGILHAAEKSVLLRADFELRLENGFNYAIANGMDVTDEMVAGAIRKDAFDYANRAILQENNVLAKAYNGAERIVMGWASDRPMIQKQMIALRYVFDATVTKGIVKTPLNFIGQALERSPIGTLQAAAYTTYARLVGIENINEAEANTIIRLWKLGAIGSAMFTWGILDYLKNDPKDRMFGGYYQPGDKRGEEDVQWGRVRIGNVQIPAWLTEAPAVSAQMGSTFARVAFSRMSKKDAHDKGYLAGTVATLLALGSSAPIVSPITNMARSMESGHADQILWQEAAGWIPGLLQNAAADIDQKSRKAESFSQELELGVPVLRSNVPETKSQKKRDQFEALHSQ
jgi:hypothetical protein